MLAALLCATATWAEHENDYLVLAWDGSQVIKTWQSIPTGDGVVLISDIAAGSSIVMGKSTSGETYVVADADATIDRSIWIHGTVHFILKNGVTVQFKKGLYVKKDGDNAVLNIYAQSEDESVMGKLIATNSYADCAGIGGTRSNDVDVNIINIHGGNISATGGDDGAGIGGGEDHNGGRITIYGGKVSATGSGRGAGIGGGYAGGGGTTTIYGGKVTAQGGRNAAGIGGGEKYRGGGNVGTVVIWGGTVNATGGYDGAGIGSGVDCVNNTGSVTIHGGTVTATGGLTEDSYYYGFSAGIGGGKNGSGCTVTINGGTVNATGRGMYSNIDNNFGGAGIGGGSGQAGGNVTINGGRVTLRNGDMWNYSPMIGGGYPSRTHGSLTIADNLRVSYKWSNTLDPYAYANTEDRVSSCRLSDVNPLIIEPCNHSNRTYTVSGNTVNDTHTAHCPNCISTFEPELHDFSSGSTCSVCGVGTTVYNIKIYLPEAQQDGTYDGQTYSHQYTYNMVGVTVFNLPTSPVKVPGLEFKGWFETNQLTGETYTSLYTSSGEDLKVAGSEYTISANVSLVARYQVLDISLADNADNSKKLEKYDGMTANSVTLTDRRLWKDGDWNTLCLPFGLASLTGTPLEGATLKELDTNGWYDGEMRYAEEASGRRQTGFDNSDGTLYLYFKDATSIEAGKPYIIMWANGSDIENPTFNNVTISSTFTGVVSADGTLDFIGTYSPMTIAGENKSMLYLGSGNKLYYPNAAMTINACRATFQLYGITAGDVAHSRLFFGDDETNGIKITNFTNLTNSAGWYTLDGRKLDGKPTKKGLYINNGKKVVIK